MAEDRFEAYFSEKLWEMIPAVYRHEDGLAENAGVLRAFVEVMAEQAACLRRSHDRLWEDQFIELCNDWAVPYIGDLMGTRLISALNSRGRRVDVAKTIYYRRRKGTPAVLEELISDITGWEGNLVEGFRRLARARHGLDPEPAYYKGRYTGTLPGGFADLRSTHAAELSDGPFDEFHHMPDLRKPRGKTGRYGIQRLLFYLYRLRAFKVSGVSPGEIEGSAGRACTFDPSGRDIPLFMLRSRPHNPQDASTRADWGKWRSPYEWQLPAPMRCRLLGHAEYLIEDKDIIELVEDAVLTAAQGEELKTLADIHYKTEQRLRVALGQLSSATVFLKPDCYSQILEFTLIEQCGKKALYPNALHVDEDDVTLSRAKITAGNLTQLNTGITDKRLQIDPRRGRMLFIGDPPDEVSACYHLGFPAEIGAGTYHRSISASYIPATHHSGGGSISSAGILNDGVTQIDDNATYGPLGSKASVKKLIFIARNQQRPYLRIENNWVLDTGVNEDSELVLDGLWIGTETTAAIYLRGNYEKVILKHITLDPGGAKTHDDGSAELPAVALIIEGFIEYLQIESSVTGPIKISNDGYIETAVIKDSIVHNRDNNFPALELPDCELDLQRVTVIGDVQAQCLWATDSLILGYGQIENTQRGCFRFSAARNEGVGRLPRPYRPAWIDESDYLFTSMRFGDPAYMQLNENAPQAVVRGAENSSEMGAYNTLINPIKQDSLLTKVEEYMPFGLLPVMIFET